MLNTSNIIDKLTLRPCALVSLGWNNTIKRKRMDYLYVYTINKRTVLVAVSWCIISVYMKETVYKHR